MVADALPFRPRSHLPRLPRDTAAAQINGERRLNCTLFLAPRRASTTSRRLGKLPPPPLLLLLHAFHFRKGRGYYVFQTGTNPTGKHIPPTQFPSTIPRTIPGPSRQDYAVKRSPPLYSRRHALRYDSFSISCRLPTTLPRH